jgi:hypothetical protein
MKHYASNPRQITHKQLTRLRDKLARLGDLSGVVHNQRDDSIIGGNQRMVIFGEGSEPVIVERYEQPDEQGTLAHGFIIWQDKRYAYRLVDWDEQTAREANIAANLEGGAWDWGVIANDWSDAGNFGFDTNLFRQWNLDALNLREMLTANGESVDYQKEWEGMPEFEQEEINVYKTIKIHFKTKNDYQEFANLIGQALTEKTISIYYPKQIDENLKVYQVLDES